MSKAQRAVSRHLRTFFAGHQCALRDIEDGPIRTRVPNFKAAVIGPGPRLAHWTFVSLGCWDAAHNGEHGVEFVLIAPDFDARHLSTLTMTAHYHAGIPEQRLDDGHTVPIGEGWLEDSVCDHLLDCRPSAFDIKFEVASWKSGHARLLWLLPISEAERDFKVARGLDELQRCFEEARLEYWDPNRSSIL